ncbi:MAG: DUF4123 domain-containing protein [Planctomycetota bacterium]|jgi:hypothetical protein
MAETMTGGKGKVTGQSLHPVIRHVARTGDHLYGVADAARDKDLAYSAPAEFGRTIDWLFYPDAARHMLPVAPYLVPIEIQSKYPFKGCEHFDRWASHVGNSAGILLLTRVDKETLLKHLRYVFHAQAEDGHRYYFRFYDPRVLRDFLPSCSEREFIEFLGPSSCVLYESENGQAMHLARLRRDGVEIDERPLS